MGTGHGQAHHTERKAGSSFTGGKDPEDHQRAMQHPQRYHFYLIKLKFWQRIKNLMTLS